MPSKTRARNHVAIATKYARDIVAGKIPGCRWTVLACARHLQDLDRAKKDSDWPYRFDANAAARPCRFIELLPHVKGEWAKRRETIRLDVTTGVGGVRKSDGMRRYRTTYLEVPRKNAKSTLTSGVALYMLAVDGEAGAECYSAATKKDQAKIVLSAAQAMARKSVRYRTKFGVEVFANSISQPSTGSVFLALDAEGKTQDGLNAHFVANDEVHAQKKRDLYDVLETATGSRAQSLMWNITTAGSNRLGICYELRTYLIKVLEGAVEDETYFGIIYTIDEGDDWLDEAVWRKANPNYGVSVYPDDMQRLATKAAKTPAARNNFLTKRLDVWVNANAAWMDLDAWDACADPSLDPADFTGDPCIGGLDLAAKTDIAARMKLFTRRLPTGPGGAMETHYYGFGDYYLPRTKVEDGHDAYPGWDHEGRLHVTEGNVIDFDEIEDGVRADCRDYDMTAVAFDPWHATQMSGHLLEEGVPMVEVRATVASFSEPMKELEAVVLAGRFHHNGDPILRWMASNVVCHFDAKDNIYPRKERVENKIDGIVGLIMCFNRAIVSESDDLVIRLPADFQPVA